MSWLVKDLTPHVQAVGTKLLYVSIQILSAVAGGVNIYMYELQGGQSEILNDRG